MRIYGQILGLLAISVSEYFGSTGNQSTITIFGHKGEDCPELLVLFHMLFTHVFDLVIKSFVKVAGVGMNWLTNRVLVYFSPERRFSKYSLFRRLISSMLVLLGQGLDMFVEAMLKKLMPSSGEFPKSKMLLLVLHI